MLYNTGSMKAKRWKLLYSKADMDNIHERANGVRGKFSAYYF